MHPLLFYSDTCPYSRRIINTLKNTANADKVLRLVCVDNQLSKIPSEIYQVPALVVPTSNGNQVVFDSELYEWLNSILRIDNSSKRTQHSAPQPQPQMAHPTLPPPQRNQDQPFPPTLAPPHSGPPVDFMPDTDAFLCDLGGGADSANHLFAGAGEEIHLYASVGEDTGGRRDGSDDSSKDEDIINRMMAARNQEISSLYAQIPRPV